MTKGHRNWEENLSFRKPVVGGGGGLFFELVYFDTFTLFCIFGMIMVAVFLLILNQIEFHLDQNQKENCQNICKIYFTLMKIDARVKNTIFEIYFLKISKSYIFHSIRKDT